MKRNIWIALGLLMTINSHALVVSVEGQGDIPEEGLELTLTEAEEDLLSGEMVMKLEGTMVCYEPLTVTIERSKEGLVDEFCCAGLCKAGNEELTETLYFTPNGEATWFIHYMPEAGSRETIVYTFRGENAFKLTVVFDDSTQGIQHTDPCVDGVQKILRNGIIYIIKDYKTYTIQ